MRIYDHLLQFSLFQGLSRSELLQLAGSTKFGFVKLPPGKAAASDGALCTQLLFLISGTLTLTTASADHAYSVREDLSAPWLVQPEALFGLSPRYSCTATAATAADVICISKDEMLRLMDDFLIIRLNYLNLMSTLAQRRTRQCWHRPPALLRERIARFVTDRCVYPAGHKSVSILMERLAEELNASRLQISQALRAMERDGLVELHRGRIDVPSLERLFM